MPPAKTICSAVLFCLTAIVFAVCFVMLREVIGGESPWLGLLLMFYFMGLAKVGEPLFVFRMPSFIREVRSWETKGIIYQRMGVQRFGQLLRASPFRLLNTSVYLAKRPWDLQSLCRHAASFEATHFWAALMFTPYIAFVWVRGQAAVAALFLVIQVLFNIYPILHLRFLRGRLGTILARHRRERMAPPAGS
ncbi:MAG TPA: hypothetical protein VGD52_15350 [Pseudoduganella sp.]